MDLTSTITSGIRIEGQSLGGEEFSKVAIHFLNTDFTKQHTFFP